MKNHLQDMTIYAVSIVALVTVYTIGYSIGIAYPLGKNFMTLMLPQGAYDAGAMAINGFNTFMITAIGLLVAQTLIRLLSLRLASLIIMVSVVMSVAIMVAGEYIEWLWVSKIALLALMIATLLLIGLLSDFGYFPMIFLILSFMLFGILGSFDGRLDTTNKLGQVERRVHVTAVDRNYVNVRLVRSTPAGIVIVSGKEAIYYPMDKIIRITAAMREQK